jgi:hypothetical protein
MTSILKSLLVAQVNNDRILGDGTSILRIQIWPEHRLQPDYEETWCADDDGHWFLTDTWDPYGVPDEYQQDDLRVHLPDLPYNHWEEIFPE